MSRCECEPEVWEDGSVTHEQECPLYPWCPHEVVAAVCFIPCGCQCKPCRALEDE